jgi:hypothetical protein
MKNKTLENSEGAIKNGQSKKIGNKTKKKTPQKHNTISVGHMEASVVASIVW